MRDAGAGLPRSSFTRGRLKLSLDQPFDSLTAYGKAIQLCLVEKQRLSLSPPCKRRSRPYKRSVATANCRNLTPGFCNCCG